MMTEQIMLLMQTAMQQGTVSAPSKDKESETSFQDMLSQKQDAVSQEQKPASGQAQDTDAAESPQQPGTEPPVQDVAETAQQLMAAMLFQPFASQVTVQQPVEAQVVQTVVQGVQMPQQQMAAVQTPDAAETMPSMQQAAPQAMPEMPQQTSDVPQQMVQVQPQAADAAVQPVQQQSAQTQAQQTDVADQQPQQAQAKSGTEHLAVTADVQEQPLFREVEAVPIKVAENTAVVDTRASNVAEQLADTVQASLKETGDTIQIQLKPENLGHITIELVQDGGKLGLIIFTESAKTTSLLAQHAGTLGALVENHTGQTVQVQVQQQEYQQPQYDGHNQQQQQQENHPQQRQQTKDEQESFLGQLRLGLFQMENAV